MRLLLVEDEEIMADALEAGLRRDGYAVDVATNGQRGLELAELNRYDVILLDRDLPGLHGDEICRRLVASGNGARILMLTASGSVQDRVDGFEIGADDYVPKPFAFAELRARVAALMRRPARALPPVIEAGPIAVDTLRRQVRLHGREVSLSNKEYGVLIELCRQPGAVLSAEDLFERVWDERTDPFSNTVRVTMVGLRRKLGEADLVETLRGAGYRLRV